MIPGEYRLQAGPIACNSGREAIAVEVVNRGDRPIQVGSHYHFAEANPALDFDREAAHGRRLDIPAGTAARFEPGDSKTIKLVDLAGSREVYGLRNAVNGSLDSAPRSVPAPASANSPAPASRTAPLRLPRTAPKGHPSEL